MVLAFVDDVAESGPFPFPVNRISTLAVEGVVPLTCKLFPLITVCVGELPGVINGVTFASTSFEPLTLAAEDILSG